MLDDVSLSRDQGGAELVLGGPSAGAEQLIPGSRVSRTLPAPTRSPGNDTRGMVGAQLWMISSHPEISLFCSSIAGN